ncbi:uncharacterized protein LOC141611362 [Silene latifolia]|uniref:uncharacterized protein LOC141611362 n=1 Tax=Silene latifolia TaxID=37657 RepID=UPI003D788A7D
MDPNTPRAEAERWLGIAVKLLTARDFLGSKTFAIRARESDPNNQVSDQILAVIETVLAGEKRVNSSQHPDWYTVLQLPRLVRDPELIANHYRKLVTLLNPDRNRVPFADYALQLVMDAWSILSDPNKKWLFDNELAVYLQRLVEEQQQQIPQQQQQAQQQQPQSQTVAAATAAAVQQQQQINTFQFFQPPPQQQLQQQQQQQLPQAAGSMWQQQEDHFSQNNNNFSSGGSSNQLQQIEFMQMQQQLPLRPQLQQQQQQQQPLQLPPQWQMRDPTPAKGGDRNKGVVNAIAGSGLGMSANTTVPLISTPIMQTLMMPIPGLVQAQQSPVVVPVQHQTHPVEVRTSLVDGNVVIDNIVNNNNNNNNNAGVVHENNDAVNANANVAANEGNKGGEKEVESFWTSCPYCLYIFEYQVVYKECTLRCQNCGRGFHAVQIPNPPPISDEGGGGGGGGEKGKDSKESSFCCWGFFPLGFSSVAWKKQNKMGKSNVGTNWVPFSPMFACPVENGSEKFQWFESNGGAAVGPKKTVRPQPSQPRVYIDDDLEDFNSDPSDSDSSDDDWRRQRQNAPEKKKKKRKRRKVRTGRPPKHKHGVVNVQKQANHNSAVERGVSASGNHLEGGSNTQNVVVFSLAAGATKEDARRRVATATLTRNQARRRTKNMGRLDLNVEFNNEGDEQAPTASTVNGGEVGVENIEFFEGLDEFFSTLPILNVDGDEKAKPS